MTRQIVFTQKAAKPPATYSQAVKACGLIFVSGTSPADAATGAIIGSTIQEQTRQCLTNVQAILEAAGSSLAKAVSFTVVLADEDDFAGMNEEWLRWFRQILLLGREQSCRREFPASRFPSRRSLRASLELPQSAISLHSGSTACRRQHPTDSLSWTIKKSLDGAEQMHAISLKHDRVCPLADLYVLLPRRVDEQREQRLCHV